MLLYERFLGWPFAGHRDSVSELVGDGLEDAIEEQLSKHGISYRKTRRAEKIPGFDQAPDFIVPSEFSIRKSWWRPNLPRMTARPGIK